MKNYREARPHPKPTRASTQTDAEEMAISALVFLSGDTEKLERFLSLTGIAPENIREAAAQPGFLAAVLDHIAGYESLLLAFTENSGRRPESVNAARLKLGPAPSHDDF